MTASTVDLDGLLIGFSTSNYSDLSIDKTQACLLLGISMGRFNKAIAEAKETYPAMGNALNTCDANSKDWIAYEHLRKLAVWLAFRGNRIAKEFYYLATHCNLIETFKSAFEDPTSEEAATNIEQWSHHYDWVTRIGFVFDIALDPFTTSEEVVLPRISLDPISWTISERIYEFGFKASYPTIRQIKLAFLENCPDISSVVIHEETPDDIQVNFECLPLLDECIRSVVTLP